MKELPKKKSQQQLEMIDDSNAEQFAECQQQWEDEQKIIEARLRRKTCETIAMATSWMSRNKVVLEMFEKEYGAGYRIKMFQNLTTQNTLSTPTLMRMLVKICRTYQLWNPGKEGAKRAERVAVLVAAKGVLTNEWTVNRVATYPGFSGCQFPGDGTLLGGSAEDSMPGVHSS